MYEECTRSGPAGRQTICFLKNWISLRTQDVFSTLPSRRDGRKSEGRRGERCFEKKRGGSARRSTPPPLFLCEPQARTQNKHTRARHERQRNRRKGELTSAARERETQRARLLFQPDTRTSSCPPTALACPPFLARARSCCPGGPRRCLRGERPRTRERRGRPSSP